jgi:hypothetical protein
MAGNSLYKSSPYSRQHQQSTYIVCFLKCFQYNIQFFQHIGLMHEQYQFCPWCYYDMSVVLWCYHKDCVTPQTFSIKIVNKHIIP